MPVKSFGEKTSNLSDTAEATSATPFLSVVNKTAHRIHHDLH